MPTVQVDALTAYAARIFAARPRWPPMTSPYRYGAFSPSGVNATGRTRVGGALWHPARAAIEQPIRMVASFGLKCTSGGSVAGKTSSAKPARRDDGSAGESSGFL